MGSLLTRRASLTNEFLSPPIRVGFLSVFSLHHRFCSYSTKTFSTSPFVLPMQGLNIRILYHRQSLTLIPSICIEPALCEVLTPGLGCRMATAPGMRQWTWQSRCPWVCRSWSHWRLAYRIWQSRWPWIHRSSSFKVGILVTLTLDIYLLLPRTNE